MKRKSAPSKIKIQETESETIIKIEPRDRTAFDIAAWLFCSAFVIFSTTGIIIEPPEIYFVIPFYLIMITMFSPVLASYFTLKEKATITLTSENLIIRQKRPLFSYKLDIKKKNIYYLEYNKVGVNTEPFNAYVGFRSALNLFSDKVPYIGVKGDPAKSIFKYHDPEIREWIFEFLKKEIKIKN
jgi:hypothetical protein